MDIVQVAFSNLVIIIVFCMIAAGVLKVFQVATSLTEIKDLLTDIKRNAQAGGAAAAAVPAPIPYSSYTQSGEELMRAVNAEVDHPVGDPH